MARKRTLPTHQQERAGLYVRVSLDRSAHGMQDEIISPETQSDRARAYCASQGWTVAVLEQDIDESAYRQHYSRRAGLMRLLEAVERGEITRLVVWKFSRLSRRLKEFIEICDRVESAGGGVVSVSEAVDTSTSAGRLIRNILASFAQFQAEEISEQIFETWMTKAKRGERPGGISPFGSVNKKGILQPHPDTHVHLVAMYETFLKTGNIKAVWDYLKAAGVPAPVADEWNLTTIRGILTNPIYIGQLDWAGETFQGKWDPLLPEELWHAVQERFASRSTGPRQRSDARLLNAFLRCGRCGRPMWTRYAKRSTDGQAHLRRVYWCCDPQSLRRGCDLPAVDAEEAEADVWEAVQAVVSSVPLDHLVAMATGQLEARGGAQEGKRRQQLLTERDRIQSAVNTLFDLLNAGDIDRDQFRQQNDRYREQLQGIEQELTRTAAPRSGPTPAGIRAAVAAIGAAQTDDDRREVLAGLDARINAGERRVHLELLGIRINLRATRVGQTWHFGERYRRLDCQASMFTDRQIEFIRRTYHWADKNEIARRLGRDYWTLIHVARRLRREGVLAPIEKEASRPS